MRTLTLHRSTGLRTPATAPKPRAAQLRWTGLLEEAWQGRSHSHDIVFALGHDMACLWCCVGTNVGEKENSWVTVYGFANTSVISCYTMSLHWAIAQFGGGMDEVTPENVPERVYATVVFLFGFILAAVLI